MNLLEELFYGNINPSAQCFDRNSEYAKIFTMVTETEKKLSAFLKTLSRAEEEHLFSKLTDAQTQLSHFENLERFLEGFRLGASLMLETFVMPQQSVIRDINQEIKKQSGKAGRD